ncbi:methyl-accepting chemotaxis protein [Psychrobacillus sp. OK028]|uniref:methyl-accepting chemotaxis protein n=1 Tax=Psychrobacillus sp. OK028 TaxID=1884359 RepID=UPI0008883AB4|nr:HAMP domain-containing methyl-accepting chemotaxis protein [Psychrobacillus sp. OK028]SDM41853.1 methyl-accepting chemotaxis protein [Psychrobacillus sp. OK028]
MKNTLTVHLGMIIVGIIASMLLITSVATYNTAYDELYKAAGIEAYGCANITTGLIQAEDVKKIISGDSSTIDKVSEQLNWTTAHKDIFETQYIIDLNGTLLALDDNLKKAGFKAGDQFHIDEEAIAMLIDMKHSTYSEAYEFGDLERLSGYAPIFEDHDPSKDIIAINVIDFDASIVKERTWDVVSGGILISIIPLILASLVTLFLIRRKTKPLSALIAHAGEIAKGNLTVNDTDFTSKDEVGDLSRTLNTLASNLRNIIGTIQTTSVQLTKNVENNSISLNEMKDAVHQVSVNMSETAASVSDGTITAEQSSDILQNLAQGLQISKERADMSVLNSKTTMQTAEEGLTRASEISRDMDKIRSASIETSETIGRLNEATTKIQQITGSISAIAAQTNLLALNASIEAARAGEQGKGFAVVAEEVRKLAEQSNTEVEQVEKIIKDITENIKQVVESTVESTKLIETGSSTVHQTSQSLSDISTAVEKTVEEITMISDMTTTEADNSKQVVELITQLTESIREIEEVTTSISAATEQTTASIDEIANRSNETFEIAHELNQIVGKFKL